MQLTAAQVEPAVSSHLYRLPHKENSQLLAQEIEAQQDRHGGIAVQDLVLDSIRLEQPCWLKKCLEPGLLPFPVDLGIVRSGPVPGSGNSSLAKCFSRPTC